MTLARTSDDDVPDGESVMPTVFDESSFAQIRFLEGRWKGIGPDGAEFFEEYELATPTLFRSTRHEDAAFSSPSDGSTVELIDGKVVSTWGPFTWTGVVLSATTACFEPDNAPSSFCWELRDADAVAVTQRWLDADGKQQSVVITLTRIAHDTAS